MLDVDSDDDQGVSDIDALKAAFSKRKYLGQCLTVNSFLDLPASSFGGNPNEVTGAAGIEALRSRMGDLGVGTAHNTLANEEEEEKTETTGASSSNQADRERDEQLASLSAMLHNQVQVLHGATPMNTQGQEDRSAAQ